MTEEQDNLPPTPERYVVSALKYRPQTFRSVVGQKTIVDTLRIAVLKDKVAPAYLFTGPRGVGKTTTARILAKTISCHHITKDGEACGACASCLAFQRGEAPDYHELDAASNNLLDDIKAWVAKMYGPATSERYKVFVMDEVHMLTAGAFNIFLKVLESPPPGARFILCTTEKQKVIPSILSLCQTFDFGRITLEDTVEHLSYVIKEEGAEAEIEALQMIAMKANGGMRDALSLLDQLINLTSGNVTYEAVSQSLNALDHEYFFMLGKAMLGRNFRQGLLLLEEVLGKGFDGERLLIGMAGFLRELLVAKDSVNLTLMNVPKETLRRYFEMAEAMPNEKVLSSIKLINDTIGEYRVASNKRLTTELCLLRLCGV